MASLYAQRSLGIAQSESSEAIKKLSSGKRINSAKDDAAGLGIAESVAGIRNITNQSIQNAKNAISLVQVADGALEVVGKILQRALVLTTQKNDSLLNLDQQASIDNEITNLLDEIDRIRERTTFNGSVSIFGATYTFGIGANVTTTFTIPELTSGDLGLEATSREITVTGISLGQTIGATVGAADPVELSPFLFKTGDANPSDTFNIAGHGFNDGDEVIYHKGSGNEIGGMTDQVHYFVIKKDDDTFQLATSALNATNDQAIDMTSLGGSNDAFFLNITNSVNLNINSVGVDGATTDILIINQPTWGVGFKIFFHAGTATDIGDLNDSGVYVITSNDGVGITLETLSGDPVLFDANTNLTGATIEYADSSLNFATGAISIASDQFTRNNHGFVTGQQVFYERAQAIGGLNDQTSYFIINTGINTFKLALSEQDAQNNIAINLTSISGTSAAVFSFADQANNVTEFLANPVLQENTIVLNVNTFNDGDVVIYNKGGGDEIGGLDDGGIYYVVSADDNTLKLSLTEGGDPITISSVGDLTGSYLQKVERLDFQSNSSLTINISTNTITSENHGFSTGDSVVYQVPDGSTGINGLVDGETYYVIRIDDDNFQLAQTELDANNSNEINLLDSGDGPQNFVYISANNVLTSTGHGFDDGELVTYNAGDTFIGGLNDGDNYYVIRVNDDTFKLANSLADVENDNAISISGPGLGTQSFTPTSDTLFSVGHGFTTGDSVVYQVPDGSTGINGLVDGDTYYVIRIDDDNFQLAQTELDANNSNEINLLDSGDGPQNFINDSDLITSAGHGLSTGDLVIYELSDGGTPIGTIVPGEGYYVIRIDADTFKLALTLADANNGIAIDLTTDGDGIHSFIAETVALSISSLEDAIAINSSNRAELGSRINALSFAIDNLETLSNNLSQAYSRIVDTDFAAETANLTKNKILQEASAAMLAQANQMPNVVLSLLK